MRPQTTAVLVLLPVIALGAVANQLTVEDLARSSDAVVRGRVVQQVPKLNGDKSRVNTIVTIEPIDVWRGIAAAKMNITIPGGVVGDIGQMVPGAPSFELGEEVVVFLRRDALAAKGVIQYRVVSLAQGKFKVDKGEASPALQSLALMQRGVPAGERSAEAMALSELERRVKSVKP